MFFIMSMVFLFFYLLFLKMCIRINVLFLKTVMKQNSIDPIEQKPLSGTVAYLKTRNLTPSNSK